MVQDGLLGDALVLRNRRAASSSDRLRVDVKRDGL
jgi:hypothetical protein